MALLAAQAFTRLVPSRKFATQPSSQASCSTLPQATKLRHTGQRQRIALAVQAFKVEIEHQGQKHELEVPDGQNILDVALDKGGLGLLVIMQIVGQAHLACTTVL